MSPTHPSAGGQPDRAGPAYRDAYSRINAMVVVGEGLANRHFRLLARAIPEDRGTLLRLAAMEGRHALAFLSCGRQLGIHPAVPLARQLLTPLHNLFLHCDRRGDLAGCLVIQGLIVECFAVAAYHGYEPVADPYARPITARVLADEAKHLDYAEQWLRRRFATAEPAVRDACGVALPMTLSMLHRLAPDMRAIGIDPLNLLTDFMERFQQALETVGFPRRAAQRLLVAAAIAGPLNQVPLSQVPLHR